MKGLAAVLLLVVGAGGCASRTNNDVDAIAQAATASMRRGNLVEAEALVSRGAESVRESPGSARDLQFRLLQAEVLIRKHDLAAANRLLQDTVGNDPALAVARARRQFLLGWAALVDGQRPKALELFDTARSATPTGEHSDALDIEVLYGVALYQAGRGPEAEQTLLGALDAAKRDGDRFHTAAAQMNLGFGQIVQRRYDAALAWFEQVLAAEDLSELTIYGDALNNAGICYSRLGEFDRAVKAQLRSVERHEGGARLQFQQSLGQLGTTYWRWNRIREGVPYLERALSVATEAGLHGDAAVWAGNLADAYIDLGDWTKAATFNTESRRFKQLARSSNVVYNTLRDADIAAAHGDLDAARRLFGDALAASATDPSARWSAHEGLANVELAAGHPAVATRHFQTALDTIEKTRSDLLRTDYKLSFLTRLISFYRRYVDALVAQGQIERALEVADSSRGRVLAERQGVASPARATAAGFRKRAAESNATVLSYWLTPDHSYLWVVTPSAVRLVTLPPAATIDDLVTRHRAAIDDATANPLASGSAGDRLFHLLVEPALPSIPKNGKVLIVPDGSLHAINLETLPVGTDQRHYWIEDVELQIAPSLAMLEPSAPARPPQPAAASMLIVGNPTPRAPEFPALKYAPAEMRSISDHFSRGKVTTIQGEHAVPDAYRGAGPEAYEYVHFTAHATTNTESPLDSAVILAGPDSSFKLYARDVAAQPLRAELVTVSACRSAGERTYSGEGLVGFSWAFLRGGAKRVIAGLWDVDDRSTADLMDHLYGGVAEGKSIARSLRDAKLALIAKGGATAQPYYWAPFELFTLTP